MEQKNIALNDKVALPLQAFGVYQITDPKQCEVSVTMALEAGYRAIDTAAAYGNEVSVGKALAESGISRKDIFITTKLWIDDASEEGAKRSIERSLELLKTDYIDLYLIHQPANDVYGAWRTMEKYYQQGVLKSIGVSNFYPSRLVDFALHQEIKPQANQIEFNPYCQQKEALEVMRELDVKPIAWAPFAEGRNGLFDDPVLKLIAHKHNCSVARVVLAWVNAMGVAAISKSTHKERIEDNFASYELTLDEDDLKAIASLDKGQSQFFSHQDPKIMRWFAGVHFEH